MNDAEFEAQKARVQAMIDRWFITLGLRWWTRVTFEWDRERAVPGDEHGASSRETAATASVSWCYRMATIHWYLPAIADIADDDLLEWAVLHELMHIFLNEMRCQAEEQDWMKHEERVASDLASAFQWTRQHFQGIEPRPCPDVYEQMSKAVSRGREEMANV